MPSRPSKQFPRYCTQGAFSIFLFLHVIFSQLFNITNAQGTRDITIDDNDSRITYRPQDQWSRAAPTNLNYGGSHMLTESPDAVASLEFVGVGIHFLAPLWPYHVSTGLQLDDEPGEIVELIDRSNPDTTNGPETVASSRVWSRVGLQNGTHHLVVRVGAGEPYAIVDGFVIVELVHIDSQTSSSSISSNIGGPVPTPTGDAQHGNNDSDSSSSSNSKSNPPLIPIIVGVVAGSFALIFLGVLFWYCRKRGQKKLRTGSETTWASVGPVPLRPGDNTAFTPNDQLNPNRLSIFTASPASGSAPLAPMTAAFGSHTVSSSAYSDGSRNGGIFYGEMYSSRVNNLVGHQGHSAPVAAVAAGAAGSAGSARMNSYSVYSQTTQGSSGGYDMGNYQQGHSAGPGSTAAWGYPGMPNNSQSLLSEYDRGQGSRSGGRMDGVAQPGPLPNPRPDVNAYYAHTHPRPDHQPPPQSQPQPPHQALDRPLPPRSAPPDYSAATTGGGSAIAGPSGALGYPQATMHKVVIPNIM